MSERQPISTKEVAELVGGATSTEDIVEIRRMLGSDYGNGDGSYRAVGDDGNPVVGTVRELGGDKYADFHASTRERVHGAAAVHSAGWRSPKE
ncbi:MAG: hypothetical protein KA604_01615 [Candidatus Saccharimonas sp.]|nr:hypothetical protein [Candidatus Saccharimonas sp.]